MQDEISRVTPEDHLFSMVHSQSKLVFLSLEVTFVDIMTPPLMPMSRFPTLEAGLIM